MELGWEASLEMGGCSILLDGIPSSSSRCPQEDAASYLMEYQVPAADVLRKLEHVQLDDDETFYFFYTFN